MFDTTNTDHCTERVNVITASITSQLLEPNPARAQQWVTKVCWHQVDESKLFAAVIQCHFSP